MPIESLYLVKFVICNANNIASDMSDETRRSIKNIINCLTAKNLEETWENIYGFAFSSKIAFSSRFVELHAA
jgi:hypothetical protein